MRGRVIVIGASADGIQAIARVLSGLPADFAAPVFVVQHVGRRSLGYLPMILDRAGPLPAVHPHEGEPIRPGVVYVAPPDRHLLIRRGTVHLSDGPEENRFRPSVDALFRSAAVAYGAAVVGVVLTGYLYDGTVGLAAIKDRGGVAIVQDPAEAGVPSMPRNALANVRIDHVLGIDKIANVLVDLVADPPAADGPVRLLDAEDRIAGGEAAAQAAHELVVASTPIADRCPLCAGPLFVWPEPRFRRYRCAAGHAFTAASLAEEGAADLPAREG